MKQLISKSFITFIELPSLQNDTAYMAPWYYSLSEELLLKSIIRDMHANLEFIGYEVSTSSKDAKNRKLFMITNFEYDQDYTLSFKECNLFISLMSDNLETSTSFCSRLINDKTKSGFSIIYQLISIFIFVVIQMTVMYIYHHKKKSPDVTLFNLSSEKEKKSI